MARNFKQESCPPGLDKKSRLLEKERGIFDLAEKIGKLEVLNKVGGGRIREVLETVAATSDAFRTGNSAIGTLGRAAFDTVDNGAFTVLDTMGLGDGVRTTITAFQPQAVNLAVGAAKVLSQDIKQGKFKLSDIPNRVQDFQNLEQLARGIFNTGGSDDPSERYQRFQCLPSPWAVDLVKNYGPKQNFSFFVEIKLTAPYRNLPQYRDAEKHLAFMVKSSNRPHINYDYEDVNYYNFRTKVATKQTYQPISMRFMDDTHNHAAKFYKLYSEAMSPLNAIDRHSQEYNENYLSERGMNFDSTGDFANTTNRQTAGIGPLRPDLENGYNTQNVIESISLYHIGTTGNTVTTYSMYNPKITSLQPSDLNMEESGSGSEFSFDFEYDSLYVEPEYPIGKFGVDKVRQLTGDGEVGGVGALYPLYPDLDGAVNPIGSLIDSAKDSVKGALSSAASRLPRPSFGEQATTAASTSAEENGVVVTAVPTTTPFVLNPIDNA